MRNRRSGLRKMSVAATALLLVLAACSGDEESVQASSTTSTTAPVTTTSSSSAPPAPSATTSTTNTTPLVLPLAGIGETVLVVGDGGVYQIGAEGDVTLLVEGSVAYAVDDTQGGLLFQVSRGRTGDQQASRSTIVWWVPSGTSTPQELLVPTPGTDHSLSLHDAYATDDGFAVLYTRHEGVTPYEMTDRLRRFEIPARKVTSLFSSGAFEHGYREVSTNSELIAGEWVQQLGSGCFIYDLDGQPTDLVPEEASDPTSEDNVWGCRLSPDGDQLVFTVEEYDANEIDLAMLHVWDLNADTGTARFVVPGTVGTPRDIDLSATKTMATFGGHNNQQTLVFDLDAPEAEPIALPIAGRARFVDTPVDIKAPVRVGAGPQYYRFGHDGLYRLVDGVETQLEAQAVAWALDDLMGGVVFGQPYDVSRDVWWLRAGGTEPELLPITGVWDAALVDGRPMLLVTIEDLQSEYCWTGDYDGPPVMLYDLVTGDQSFLFCHEHGIDGGRGFTSFGDDLLVGVESVAVGGFGTDSRILFTDLSGQDVTVDTNPVHERCWPCFLSAEISDDGSFLAYTLWPTAFWDVPVEDGDYESAYEAWRTAAETIPVEVAVLDLASGSELWHRTIDPGVRLADFDGRYVVTRPSYFVEFGATGSVIYDTWGVHEPIEVADGVSLIRQSIADTAGIMLRPDGLGIASFGEPAEDVRDTMISLLGPPDTEYFVDPVAEQIAMPYGFGAIRYFRLSRWNQIGLHVVFSDNNYCRNDGQPHLVGWGVTRPGLQTEAGIGVGATADELVEAYGETVAMPDSFLAECGGGWTFRVEPLGPSASPDRMASMHGELNGDPQDLSTRVARLSGGATASC